MFDCKDFRTEDKDVAAEPGLRDDRPPLRARRAPARHEALAAVRDGRDGPRPDPPRLLEVHGRRAPQARARQRLRVCDPRLLQPRRPADRRGCSSRRRRDDRLRRLRPRREEARRRLPRQRVAAQRGPARLQAEPDGVCLPTTSGSTGRNDRVGRRRLLRAGLPQRRGPRARRDSRRRGLREGPRRPRSGGSRRSRTTGASRWARGSTSPRSSTKRSTASRPT